RSRDAQLGLDELRELTERRARRRLRALIADEVRQLAHAGAGELARIAREVTALANSELCRRDEHHERGGDEDEQSQQGADPRSHRAGFGRPLSAVTPVVAFPWAPRRVRRSKPGLLTCWATANSPSVRSKCGDEAVYVPFRDPRPGVGSNGSQP